MIGIDIGMFMSGIVVVEAVFRLARHRPARLAGHPAVDIPIIMGVTLVSASPSSSAISRRPRRSTYRSAHQAALTSITCSTRGDKNAKCKALTCRWRSATLLAPLPPASPTRPSRAAMIVTYKDDVATLDPAIGYDWQNWSMIKSLFDG
jgi:hypothetical protein